MVYLFYESTWECFLYCPTDHYGSTVLWTSSYVLSPMSWSFVTPLPCEWSAYILVSVPIIVIDLISCILIRYVLTSVLPASYLLSAFLNSSFIFVSIHVCSKDCFIHALLVLSISWFYFSTCPTPCFLCFLASLDFLSLLVSICACYKLWFIGILSVSSTHWSYFDVFVNHR